jgi:hypothetical protein
LPTVQPIWLRTGKATSLLALHEFNGLLEQLLLLARAHQIDLAHVPVAPLVEQLAPPCRAPAVVHRLALFDDAAADLDEACHPAVVRLHDASTARARILWLLAATPESCPSSSSCRNPRRA